MNLEAAAGDNLKNEFLLSQIEVLEASSNRKPHRKVNKSIVSESLQLQEAGVRDRRKRRSQLEMQEQHAKAEYARQERANKRLLKAALKEEQRALKRAETEK